MAVEMEATSRPIFQLHKPHLQPCHKHPSTRSAGTSTRATSHPREAAWKAMDFPMSGMYPRVDRLPVHLEDAQSVTIVEPDHAAGQAAVQAARQEALDRAAKTRLASFFAVCQENNPAHTNGGTHPSAQELTYQQFLKAWARL
jgi:hypothetical protein